MKNFQLGKADFTNRVGDMHAVFRINTQCIGLCLRHCIHSRFKSCHGESEIEICLRFFRVDPRFAFYINSFPVCI